MAIRVDVKLLFDLKRYAPDKSMPFSIQLAENATLGNLLDNLRIVHEPEMVALVDGNPGGMETKLHQNSRITIFPVVLGG